MTDLRRPRITPLVSLLLVFATQASAEGFEGEAAAPDPTLAVYLETDYIVAGGEVPIGVWLSNTSGLELTAVEIQIDGPPFLSWSLEDCSGAAQVRIPLASMAPFSSKSYSARLCASTDAFDEGEKRFVIFLDYSWGEGVLRKSMTKVTPLKITCFLFEGQRAAGNALLVITLLAPGLVFLGALRLCAFPYTDRLGTLETLGLSIAISVGLQAGRAYLARYLGWLEGSSTVRDFLTALGFAAVVGILVVSGWVVINWIGERLERRALASEQEPVERLLLKALEGNVEGMNVATVLHENRRYEGSTALQARGGDRIVLPWYSLRVQDGPLAAKMRDLLSTGKWSRVLRIAADRKIPLEVTNAIRVSDGKSQLEVAELPVRVSAPSSVKFKQDAERPGILEVRRG